MIDQVFKNHSFMIFILFLHTRIQHAKIIYLCYQNKFLISFVQKFQVASSIVHFLAYSNVFCFSQCGLSWFNWSRITHLYTYGFLPTRSFVKAVSPLNCLPFYFQCLEDRRQWVLNKYLLTKRNKKKVNLFCVLAFLSSSYPYF